MGNLVRGSEKILVNSVDQTIFGAFIRSADSVRMLVHKPTGIHIPGTASTMSVKCGYGQEEVLETMLLNLYAPYPCETCNYVSVMNMQSVPFKNGRVETHREEYRPYTAKVDSLSIASGTEIADADKLSIYRQLVPNINADKYRFVDAGMVWVVTNEDSDDASTLTITLQDGTEHLITVAATDSIATVVNANTSLNPYIKAYTPSVTNSNDGYTCIIESIAPVFFEVTAGTDTSVDAFYVKLEQKKTSCQLIINGGSANSLWEKIPYNKITLGKGTMANDATTDADCDIVIDSTTIEISPAGANIAAKLLNAAEEMSISTATGTLTNTYMAALDVAAVGLTLIVIGKEVVSVKNHAVSDLLDISIQQMSYQMATKDWMAMAQIFPDGYGQEFLRKEHVDPTARYFWVSFEWKTDEYDNVTMNGNITKTSRVEFYIKESQMPATVAAATGEYWDGAVTNMMSDTLPSVPTLNIAELINWAGNWNGTTTGITDTKLAG